MSTGVRLAVSLLLLCTLLPAYSIITPIQPVEDGAACGSSKIKFVNCIMQRSSELPLPFIAAVEYVSEDNNRVQICKTPQNDPIPYNFTLLPGDSIYGLRVCYDDKVERVVGLMFSGVAKQYVCGNVWQPPQQCVMSSSRTPAPLSYMKARCDAVFVGVENVCWSKFYRPKGGLQQACPAGQGMATGGSLCQACRIGTYNPGGLSSCATCPQGQTTVGTGASSCGCPPGQGFHPIKQVCITCQPGTYSPGGSLTPCVPCPMPFMSSARGSATIEECVCQPGYGYNKGKGTCVVCEKNYYSDGSRKSSSIKVGSPTLQACTACKDNQITNRPQSKTVKRCFTAVLPSG